MLLAFFAPQPIENSVGTPWSQCRSQMDNENRQAAQGERGRTDRAPRSSQSRQSSMIARSTGEET